MARRFSGRRLRETRKSVGVSAEQLAIDTGRTTYSIHGYERGRIQPPLDVAARLAAALGCTVDDLLDDESGLVGAGVA